MLGAGLYGVLVAEARVARKVIGNATDSPPDATGWYGRGRPGPAIRIALLGDSSAAGYGVERVEGTPGAQLATSVAAAADRRVHLRSPSPAPWPTRSTPRSAPTPTSPSC